MRKVKVGLEADVAGFVRGVDSAKRSVDDLGDEVKQLDKELDKIPLDAAKAGAALKLLDGDVKSVGRTVNDLGEKNTGLAVLDAKVREAQKEVRKLGDEFIRTGDIDVFKKLGDAEGKLRGLKEVRKALANAVLDDDVIIQPKEAKGLFSALLKSAGEAGTEAGRVFSGGLTGVLSTPELGPIVAVALAAALTAAIGIALATAGGAVLAAGGLGGVGLGIAGAIMGDPEGVGKAWKDEIGKIKAEWLGASAVFRGPLIDAAHQFGAVIGGIGLDRILAKAAIYLPMLTQGLAGFIRGLGGGLESLIDAAGPVMKVLATELPMLGSAFEQMFQEIASGGEGGAQALQDVLQVIERLIVGLGGVIGFAERAYGAFAKLRDATIPRDWFFNPDTGEKISQVGRVLVEAGDAARTATVDYEKFGDALNRTAATADTAIGSIVDKVLGGMLAMDRATLSFAEALTRLKDSFDENGKSVDIHTKKGQANREALIAVAEANKRVYDEMIAGNSTVAEATAAYDANTKALEETARKAGLTEQQIHDLIGRYGKVPDDVNTEVGAHGLTEVLANLDETLRALNHLDGRRADTYLYNHVITQYGNDMGLGHQGSHALGAIRHAATGFIVGPSDPGTLIGEPQTGGEALIPLRGISQMRAMGLAQTVGNSYGFSVAPNGGGAVAGTLAVTLGVAPTAGGAVGAMLQQLVLQGQVQLFVNGQPVSARP